MSRICARSKASGIIPETLSVISLENGLLRGIPHTSGANVPPVIQEHNTHGTRSLSAADLIDLRFSSIKAMIIGTVVDIAEPASVQLAVSSTPAASLSSFHMDMTGCTLEAIPGIALAIQQPHALFAHAGTPLNG